ncbi:MAG: hypothetical protein AAFZ63_15535 [Bacteroidota bacterium]
MKNLLEIAGIVTKKKVKKIEIFDEHSLRNKSSKFNEFYDDLTSGVYKNDRDAANKLYGCSPKDARYRQLKSRFRKRLLNTLFFLDVNKPSASNYDRAHFTCHKEWTLVKILQDNNAYSSAIGLARSILTTSQKFHISEIIVNCARILREDAASHANSKDFEHYDDLLKSHTMILNAEMRSEELKQRVVMDYFRPLHKDNDLEQRIDTYSNTLLSLSEVHDSPLIFYNMFLVWAMRYEMNREYEALLEVCERAESYIVANPRYYQEEKLIDFYIKKMSAYLHLGNYSKGQINAEQCLKQFPEGSRPWFMFMEYYLLLALHTDHHIQALAIYNQTVSNKRFIKQGTELRERWKLFEAVIYFLLDPMGLAGRLVPIRKRETFVPEKFVDRSFYYGADQKKLTVLMLSMQVFYLVKAKKYNRADELIGQLQNMANRNLHKEEYFRSIQFIRLLLLLRKANYQKDELRNVDKYMARLQERPFTYRGVSSQFEPIPLERLWEIFVDRLE